MAQLLSPSRFGESGRSRPLSLAHERPSPYLASIARAGAPEPPLVVEFVGITEDQQRTAISGFPGGKRFVLAAPRVSGKLLRQS